MRINTLLSHIRDFLTYAEGNITGIEGNAFEKVRMSKQKKIDETTENYVAFTREDLGKIFEPKGYAAYARGKAHYYWVPILALHSGARPDELASLDVAGVRNEAGIDYLQLKKGKNATSKKRKIPLHKAVLDAGFLDYVEKVRATGKTQLFPDLIDGHNGFIKNITRRFNEWHLDGKLKLTDPTKRLYSFRATFISRMSELHMHPATIMAIVGHYEQSQLDLSLPHFDCYQSEKLLRGLKDTIDAFDIAIPMVPMKG